MSNQKMTRPAFRSVELDPMDARLEARAAEKGIPTLVAPSTAEPSVRTTAPPPTERPAPPASGGERATSRARINIEIPDYAWIELKTRAAREMVSVRHFIMSALKARGIAIEETDMVEDGRRRCVATPRQGA